jgi:hypothetical protein
MPLKVNPPTFVKDFNRKAMEPIPLEQFMHY